MMEDGEEAGGEKKRFLNSVPETTHAMLREYLSS
jgi:hypothetical protein